MGKIVTICNLYSFEHSSHSCLHTAQYNDTEVKGSITPGPEVFSSVDFLTF